MPSVCYCVLLCVSIRQTTAEDQQMISRQQRISRGLASDSFRETRVLLRTSVCFCVLLRRGAAPNGIVNPRTERPALPFIVVAPFMLWPHSCCCHFSSKRLQK